MRKEKKTWFITGASKGLGLEIVKAALKKGDNVAATIRNPSDSISDQLGNPSTLLEVQMDVTVEAEVKAGVEKAVVRFGGLDIIVNNAGFGIVTGIEEASDAEARAQYDTNVFGVLNVIRAVLPILRKQRSGHIINTSSLFGFDAVPAWGLYGSTKFAVEGISQGLAKEVAPFGIKVTAIEPGLFTTGFMGKDSFKLCKNPIDDYNDTSVGRQRLAAASLHGTQQGDPAKLAKVVVDELVGVDSPPLHLPIGPDSVAMYESNAKRLASEVATWRNVSMSTDHDNK